MAALVLMFAGMSAAKDPKEMKFCISQGWLENPSSMALNAGYKDAMKQFGGTGTFANANFDSKKQIDQIAAFIEMKPDALFVAPADTKAITPIVQKAIDAGIPVFSADTLVAGAAVINTAFSNNFGMGEYSGDYIAKRLNGKGKVGTVELPNNETWDMRAQGFFWAMRKYPDIKVVARWAYNPAGNVRPRQAIDNMLAANPKKGDIDAFFCGWDGASMEGALAVKAAGREKEGIFFTGIDGGVQPFEYIVQEGNPFAMDCSQSMYMMAYLNVFYAQEYLAGNKVPRIIITPTYAVDRELLLQTMKKTGSDIKKIGATYDRPGEYLKLGWVRAL
jgi:ribose transport system substrate-binding protein